MCHDLSVATVRRELRIPRPPDQVWAIVGDVGAIHRWFPGIVGCTLSSDDDGGQIRTVELGTGMRLVERVVTNDPILRRFQYRIEGGVFREHLGTIDVHDLGEDTSLVVYGTDALPDVMALVIGGASGAALHRLAELLEQEHVA